MPDPFDWFNILIAKLGITPSQGLFAMMILMMGFNIIGRLIPDSAVGWLGTTRKVCKCLGLFIQNRVLPGITVGDVALAAHGTAVRANAVANVAAEVAGVEILPQNHQVPTQSEITGRGIFAGNNTEIPNASAR